MKKLIQISALFLVSAIYAQQVSEYQYILVPSEFKDVKTNKFGLNSLLSSKLKAKNYIVFNQNPDQQPASVTNPCEILKAELADTSSIFTNKARITFSDCNDKEIASFDGKSSKKDFEAGMRDALQNALNAIPPSSQTKKAVDVQKEVPQQTLQKAIVAENPVVVQKEVVAQSDVRTETKSTAEIYTNGTLTLNKIILTNGEFILVNPNSAVPYAIFKPSTRKDSYRVQLSDGTATLGYLEAGKIVVEVSNVDGSLRREVFERK